MIGIETPLHPGSLVSDWRWDTSTVLVTALLGVAYAICFIKGRQRGERLSIGRAVCFAVAGLGVWLYSGLGWIGVYSGTLFWVRALQVLLLLYVVPFAIAAGAPFTVLRAALGPAGRERLDAALSGGAARLLTHPATGAMLILLLPWALFLTPWYEAVLRHGGVDAITRILVVAMGFLYFYSRLQVDPVAKHFTQGLSLLITIAESLADGILGIVLWLGPLIATGYYASLGRSWGPDARLDQTIGAGILWLLGDLLGLIYSLVVMRAFAADEKRKAGELDAELDAAEAERVAREQTPRATARGEEDEEPVSTGLWWENDPQLRARFRR
ncbi:cytochrome c oxidase assembly protein [Nocardia seriolae]|uniref:Cytochrome c oxidase assembly protein n=3 Tax=Nocardia seriolae TaxID=37332 RepID=A0ABC9YP65_9NOCA|nr:cytochrome c oxidase assembly protein [Nocardia seriolae]MTJ75196.1 cytochrome c oxidase assembly protein [Nocardia seriolae]MTJ89898.1 cytochrome c oxidase assembly protein [Nocardia seriolae]MTK50476.1 cytochrome c oxidase assembly protein [Nocardia seriolae]PSK33371.1 cytochrome c oxidase assembly protein [Nocardia seriolae]RLP32799.1 cytochrome c oxidase assembly protein [Nocardia seriolae]